MQYHNYSLSEIDGLIPWEREVYVSLCLMEHIKEQKEQAQRDRNMVKSTSEPGPAGSSMSLKDVVKDTLDETNLLVRLLKVLL